MSFFTTPGGTGREGAATTYELSGLPRSPDDVRLVVQQLRAGLHALERPVRERLAKAITLILHSTDHDLDQVAA